MDQFEQWIGTGPKIFRLLYAITRDGCNATTFHQQCDNQGPTVTVLYKQQGSVYGGYTSANWVNNGGYQNDPNAFLYQLYHSKSPKCTKFPYRNNGNAIYTAGYGPTFGGGHDLCTFNGSIQTSGGYFALNGSMAIGSSYNNLGMNENQINNGTMNVTELEVYAVKDDKREPPKPWRKTKHWNEKYTPYKVKVKSGAALNFRLCDTRGLEESQGLDVLECSYLLDGNIPDYYQFNPNSAITPKTHGFKSTPSDNDIVHCVVFVLDITTLDVLSTKIVEKIKSFQEMMKERGIPQLILLTNIDKLSEDLGKDVSLVFSDPYVEACVEKASQLFGLPRANVLPVKNYENEDESEDNKSILALLALRKILHFTEDFLDQMFDRRNDEQPDIEKINLSNKQ